MQTHEIRKRFLDHFVQAGHTEVPSASLILNDPKLLLVNAGMVPFKPYFLGESRRRFRARPACRSASAPRTSTWSAPTAATTPSSRWRATSPSATTSRGVIPLAWELLTIRADGGYGFDPQRLWPTVYLDDDEAFRIWPEVVGVPAERVQRRDREDNYWSMGVPGPCGPCSEIYFDRGPEYGVTAARRRRGALPRDLEPRLHAVHPG